MRVKYIFEIYRAKNKQFAWRQKASNGKIVADSGETYHNRRDALRYYNNLKAMVKNPELIRLVDLTK